MRVAVFRPYFFDREAASFRAPSHSHKQRRTEGRADGRTEGGETDARCVWPPPPTRIPHSLHRGRAGCGTPLGAADFDRRFSVFWLLLGVGSLNWQITKMVTLSHLGALGLPLSICITHHIFHREKVLLRCRAGAGACLAHAHSNLALSAADSVRSCANIAPLDRPTDRPPTEYHGQKRRLRSNLSSSSSSSV